MDPIIATRLFDIKYAADRSSHMWAMWVASEVGLLLQQIRDLGHGSLVHERLGILATCCILMVHLKGSLEEIRPLEYHAMKDRLPMETVMLI